jgi:hypothetical protein
MTTYLKEPTLHHGVSAQAALDTCCWTDVPVLQVADLAAAVAAVCSSQNKDNRVPQKANLRFLDHQVLRQDVAAAIILPALRSHAILY